MSSNYWAFFSGTGLSHNSCDFSENAFKVNLFSKCLQYIAQKPALKILQLKLASNQQEVLN